jgi:predicted HTH transcriptional regulator
MMKNWEKRALALFERTLHPVPGEINELDWKTTLSDKSERIAQHLSAFSNLSGGGFLIFGVKNDGSIQSLPDSDMSEIVQKIGNIARNNLANPVTIDHVVVSYENNPLLLIHTKDQIA